MRDDAPRWRKIVIVAWTTDERLDPLSLMAAVAERLDEAARMEMLVDDKLVAQLPLFAAQRLAKEAGA